MLLYLLCHTRLILWTLGPFNVFSAQPMDLFAWCVRLSQVGLETHLKSLHFHHQRRGDSGPAPERMTVESSSNGPDLAD